MKNLFSTFFQSSKAKQCEPQDTSQYYDRYWTFDVESDGDLIFYCGFKNKNQYNYCFDFCMGKHYGTKKKMYPPTSFKLNNELHNNIKEKMKENGYEIIVTLHEHYVIAHKYFENNFYTAIV